MPALLALPAEVKRPMQPRQLWQRLPEENRRRVVPVLARIVARLARSAEGGPADD